MSDKQLSVRALERGLDILECLSFSEQPLTLSELAEHTSLSPSTAIRILHTLEKKGFILRNAATKLYRLGPKTRMLQDKTTLYEMMFAMAEAPMAALSEEFGESISLFVPRGDKRVCVKRVESLFPLRQVVNVGDSLSLNAGASGKVLCALLAAQSDLDPATLLPPLTEDALRQIREQGHATSFGERASDTYAVAAPVFDANGKIIAALALSGPVSRHSEDMLRRMVSAVMLQADAISTGIGWRGMGPDNG